MSTLSLHKPSTHQRERIARFLIHLICIGMLFVLPEVLMGLTRPHPGHMPWGIYAKSLIFVAIFYVNYYFVIDRCTGRHSNLSRFIAYSLALISISLILNYLIMTFGFGRHHSDPMDNFRTGHRLSATISFLSRDLAMTVLTIGLSVALKLSDRWHRLERRQQMLASARREQELMQLKSQLNPHFLFNSLNTIYALIAISPDQAQNAVHTLSRLLRYALYDSSGTVSIKQEIDFLNDYINLMALRLGNRPGLTVSLNAGDHEDTKIPAMLFISMVENVFKHGNTGRSDDMFHICLTTDNNTLRFVTKNRFDPLREKSDASGIGIPNIRRRLRLIYGDNASLNCNATDEIYTVEMTIDLDTLPENEVSDTTSTTNQTTT